ncbi:MAG: dipeptidase [Candidatus Delongbacteria bacterium]|nr:dipeptidase [Candidatus Delongbacteria bacterium]
MATISLDPQWKDKVLQELTEFLSIQSVSTKPENHQSILEAAGFLMLKIKSLDFDRIRLVQTPGNPIILAEKRRHPGRPTLMIYGHYDVQPEEPLELWTTPPFEATIKGDRLYARGASDDKGQLYIHLAAVEYYQQRWGDIPLNLILLLEGEEEIGSVNLDEFLKSGEEKLDPDLIIISDSSMLGENLPSICCSLRGLATFEMRIRGANTDLHSGGFGGVAPNPAEVLCRIIAQLKAESGQIMIPGFYDQVMTLSPEERRRIGELPLDEAVMAAEIGLSRMVGEPGYGVYERLWFRPTFEINGLYSGYAGPGFKTVLPAEAVCKFSCRLVPYQDPELISQQIVSYVQSLIPDYVTGEVKALHSGSAYRLEPDHPLIPRFTQALTQAFGMAPYMAGEGGSIPIVHTFKQLTGSDSLLLGFGLPNENSHAPNEFMSLSNLWRGIETMLLVYRSYAE